MSTTFTAPAPAQRIAPQRRTGCLLATLKRLWAAYETWRIEQAAIVALQALSDRDLKDIGLTRGEIVHAARGHEVGGRAPSRHWHTNQAEIRQRRPGNAAAGSRGFPHRP